MEMKFHQGIVIFHICIHPTQDHMNCFFAPPDGF
ncbi:hypothetical protein SM0020_03470 [Sinorhizobium meliloti CCNWSX0020]|uniref:Uncharacterized protein n=1 Tax=Sinorhizobium meliloti CCNWSX0020 TaxID=1107881 RepID=H0FU65_RHIML|nr:hypothetical protein SM0020_03470 [Sinorhizobium meliloti CCNWSX0020]